VERSGAAHPRRGMVFWTATGIIALDTVLFTMVVPALPDFAERDGFSTTVAALVFAAFPVGPFSTALVAAGLVDRIGRRPVLVVAVLALAVATLAFAVASGAGPLALARLAQGAAAGFVWTAGLAAISDVYPADQLGFRIGLSETAGGAFGLVGPLAAGALIEAVGTTTTFAMAAALPALALGPALALPETRRGGGLSGPPLLPALRRVVAIPRARVAVVALAVVAAVLALVEPLLPLDLDDRLGLSALGIGLVFSAGLLAYFACVPIAGRWSDRRGRRLPTLIGGALIVVALPLVAVGPAWWVAVAFAVVGAGMAALGASTGALMVEAVDEAGMAGRYGLSSALLTIVFSMGYVAGPLLGAAGSAVAPFPVTALVAAAMVLAAVVWIARALPGSERATSPLAAGPRGGPPTR
jgi:MFS transporter, DHA1 family, solute carrier family 18 (vesicular amine transporter), member 1/2